MRKRDRRIAGAGMGRKSTRGVYRERRNYSGLLAELQGQSSGFPSDEKGRTLEAEMPQISFFRQRIMSDERVRYLYKRAAMYCTIKRARKPEKSATRICAVQGDTLIICAPVCYAKQKRICAWAYGIFPALPTTKQFLNRCRSLLNCSAGCMSMRGCEWSILAWGG